MLLSRLFLSVATIGLCSLLSACQTTSNVVESEISFPQDYFVEVIRGESCQSPRSFSSGINFIRDLETFGPNWNAKGNSLTVNNGGISKRWAALLELSYTAAATSNAEQSKELIRTLMYLAEKRLLLDALKVNEIKSSCYAGSGNVKAKCPYHIPQHTSFLFTAMLNAANVLSEYTTQQERSVLESYFASAYQDFIKPLASSGLRDQSFYEFGDGGLGVLAYARFTNDKSLAASEIGARKNALMKVINDEGYIDNNSYRGVRAYWYHTLGANSAYGYALVAREFGVDFFRDQVLGPKLKALAEKVVEGTVDYKKFMSKGNRGYNHSKDPIYAQPHMHQMAVSLPIILKREFGINVPLSSAYVSKVSNETIDRIIGFNADCYYASK
jgi:hypothetical protein